VEPPLEKRSRNPLRGKKAINDGDGSPTNQNPKTGDREMKPMKRKLLAAVCGASLLVAGAAAVQAKTLVFCSEGSPEGFNPAFYTAGTTFDASSRAIFNRLVEFERGTTKIGPALAEKWEVSDDGLEYTFHHQ
jgi:ABC-type transport system substrate-binding protein